MVTDKLKARIFEEVDRAFDDQLAFLSGLVSFASVAGNEGPCQLFVADECRKAGMEVEVFQPTLEMVKDHPAYTEIGIDYANRPDVIGRLAPAGQGRSLILNGHIDVVPPDPVSEWTSDPFKARMEAGRLYGRGALDMKGGVSANFFAIKAVLASGIRPQGALTFETVIEEELGGSGGSLACFLHGVTADGMVIPECSQQSVWVTHPGVKYFRVKVTGKPAHAALSHEGVNAVVKMMPIVAALDELDRKRAASLSYPLVEQETGRSCNLSIGKMMAGEWVSKVAGWAVLECRVGYVPGETGPAVVREVEETVRGAVAGDDWFKDHPVEIEWFGWNCDPWVEPLDSPVIGKVLEAARQVPGMEAKVTGASCGLDNRFAPFFGMPSVSFGPKGGNLHGIDEWVDLDSLKRLTKALALFVCDWCGAG